MRLQKVFDIEKGYSCLFLTSDRPQKLGINGPQTRPDCQKARHLVELAALGSFLRLYVTEMVPDIIWAPDFWAQGNLVPA